MSLEAILYEDGKLDILDQLLLPMESKYIPVTNTEDGWQVIHKMQVRGAPAIGVVGCLSLAVELHQKTFSSPGHLIEFITEKLDYLVTSRPTAVNMKDSRDKLVKAVKKWACEKEADGETMKSRLLAIIENMQAEDIATNKAMGKHGATHLLGQVGAVESVTVLTHCNTGSLATAGYGTALGVVRRLSELGRLKHCYCTETRPYNQGSRLTAYELVYDKLPATLICDSMASFLMKKKGVSAIFLGADRVVANGDTANKIGTYQLAIVAKHHGVPFYVVAPSTSIDLSMASGDEIVIEERPHQEMTTIKGIQMAPKEIGCWNPAFDVTPAELITGGIVTEFGVFTPGELGDKLTAALESRE